MNVWPEIMDNNAIKDDFVHFVFLVFNLVNVLIAVNMSPYIFTTKWCKEKNLLSPSS